jgi:serine/threonine protein kinase
MSAAKGQGREAETSPDGRYVRLDEKLGAGAYKVVWMGLDTENGGEVAWNSVDLKRMPESEQVRVRAETRLLSQLDHPRIIDFYHVWENPERKEICFTTEIVSSGTLRQYAGRSKNLRRLKVIRNWMNQILDALVYLHSRKPAVIHRDLKCDNIFINGKQGTIVLGDFGLSSFQQQGQTQSVLGTPEFMAPELYDEAYNCKVDIYAFGMCVLELLTDEYPYAECNNNPIKIYNKVTNGELPESLQRVQDTEMQRFIELCLLPAALRPSAFDLKCHPFLTSVARNNHVVQVDDPVVQEKDVIGQSEDVIDKAVMKAINTTSKPHRTSTDTHTTAHNTQAPSSPRPATIVEGQPAKRGNSSNDANAHALQQQQQQQHQSPPRDERKPVSDPSDGGSSEASAHGQTQDIPESLRSPTRRFSEINPYDVNAGEAFVQGESKVTASGRVYVGVDVHVNATNAEFASVSLVLHYNSNNKNLRKKQLRKKQLNFDFQFESDTPQSIAGEMTGLMRFTPSESMVPQISNAIKDALFDEHGAPRHVLTPIEGATPSAAPAHMHETPSSTPQVDPHSLHTPSSSAAQDAIVAEQPTSSSETTNSALEELERQENAIRQKRRAVVMSMSDRDLNSSMAKLHIEAKQGMARDARVKAVLNAMGGPEVHALDTSSTSAAQNGSPVDRKRHEWPGGQQHTNSSSVGIVSSTTTNPSSVQHDQHARGVSESGGVHGHPQLFQDRPPPMHQRAHSVDPRMLQGSTKPPGFDRAPLKSTGLGFHQSAQTAQTPSRLAAVGEGSLLLNALAQTLPGPDAKHIQGISDMSQQQQPQHNGVAISLSPSNLNSSSSPQTAKKSPSPPADVQVGNASSSSSPTPGQTGDPDAHAVDEKKKKEKKKEKDNADALAAEHRLLSVFSM